MKLGIVRLSRSKSILNGHSFYNVQCIGLGKALSRSGFDVTVYRCIFEDEKRAEQKISDNLTICEIPSKGFKTNGFLDFNQIDKSLDAYIVLSDVQLDAGRVIRKLRKQGKLVLPYIGVMESHSDNKIVKKVIDLFSKVTIREYRKGVCLAKTPRIKSLLNKLKVKDVEILPVGLDTDLLFNDYKNTGIDDIRKQLGILENQIPLLFIGRLTNEKDPIRMLNVFYNMSKKYENLILLMIGNGELKSDVETFISAKRIEDRVKLIESVKNDEIWKYYRVAKCFINLNIQEIFGMSILEAMYYECPVIACHAPGPDYIISDRIDGYLVNSDSEIEDCIDGLLQKKTHEMRASHEKIENQFTWENSINVLLKELKEL